MEIKAGQTVMAQDDNGVPFVGEFVRMCAACPALVVKDQRGNLHHVEKSQVIHLFSYHPFEFWLSPLPTTMDKLGDDTFKFTWRFGWPYSTGKSTPKPEPKPDEPYMIVVSADEFLTWDPENDDDDSNDLLTEEQAMTCAKQQANKSGETVGVYMKIADVKPGEPIITRYDRKK